MCNGYDHRLQNQVGTGCDFSSTTFWLSIVFQLGSLRVECKINRHLLFLLGRIKWASTRKHVCTVPGTRYIPLHCNTRSAISNSLSPQCQDSGAWSCGTHRCLRRPGLRKCRPAQHSDTLPSGNGRGRDNVRRGGKERMPKKTSFPPPGEERSEGPVPKGPRAPAPHLASPGRGGMAEQSTHSSKLCGTAFRVYLEIILLFLLLIRGRHGHARVGASRPGPPAGSCPDPSRHLPAPSRPVA